MPNEFFPTIVCWGHAGGNKIIWTTCDCNSIGIEFFIRQKRIHLKSVFLYPFYWVCFMRPDLTGNKHSHASHTAQTQSHHKLTFIGFYKKYETTWCGDVRIRTWVCVCLWSETHTKMLIFFFSLLHTYDSHAAPKKEFCGWHLFVKPQAVYKLKVDVHVQPRRQFSPTLVSGCRGMMQNCIRCDRLTFHSTQFYSDVIDSAIHHIPSTQQDNNGAHGTKCFLEVIYYSCRTMKYSPSDYNITSSVGKPT